MTSLLTLVVPWWLRIVMVVALIGACFGIGAAVGVKHEGEKKDLLIAKMQHDFDARVGAAQTALIAANQRAAAQTTDAAFAITNGVNLFHGAVDEQTKSNDFERGRVAGLAAGRERVFVGARCTADPSDRTVSRDSSPSTRADGGATFGRAELSAEGAGRVGSVAADADAEVRSLRARLRLGQDYARAAFAACGAK